MSLEIQNKIYNLQQIKKKLLDLNLEQNERLVINEFNPTLGKIYGVFSSDNSFLFVKEKNCLGPNYSFSVFGFIAYIMKLIGGGDSLISRKYYLVDFFSRVPISEKEDEKYQDGYIYEYNGIDYYVILLSKIVPASFLNNIPLENISIIQDEINVFLADNPEFINQVLFSEETIEQEQTPSTMAKKLNYKPNENK